MRFILALLVTTSLSGCLFFPRSPVIAGVRITNDRFEVAKLDVGVLSEDQRKVYRESGIPKYIVFERELGTGKPVQRWLYPDDKLSYVFLAGRKVDYVVVESEGKNPFFDATAGDQGPLLILWQWAQLTLHWLRDR